MAKGKTRLDDKFSNPKKFSDYIQSTPKPSVEIKEKITVVQSAPLSEMPVDLVSVGDLPKGTKFVYNGILMQKINLLPGGMIGCRRLVKHQFSDTFIPSGSAKLSASDMVEKK
jgi:hypothetical protein